MEPWEGMLRSSGEPPDCQKNPQRIVDVTAAGPALTEPQATVDRGTTAGADREITATAGRRAAAGILATAADREVDGLKVLLWLVRKMWRGRLDLLLGGITLTTPE